MSKPFKLTDLHGPISKCTMCLPATNIHKQFCGTCFGRGYLAMCLACDGQGKTRVPVGGSIGEMDSTCNHCGGKGTFPASEARFLEQEANKPSVVEEPLKEKTDFPLQAGPDKVRLLQPADLTTA